MEHNWQKKTLIFLVDNFMEGIVWDLVTAGYADSMAETIDKLARTPLSKILMLSIVLTIVRAVIYPKLKSTPEHERYGAFKALKFVDGVTDAVVYAAIVVFMLVRPFVLQTFNIPSGSMIDTLRVGDFIIANKNIYRHSEPHRGDIVVFKPPARALFPGQDPETNFIKRLIGTPGDLVEWKNKQMYVNGEALPEPYADYTKPSDPNGPPLPKDMWGSIEQANFKIVKDGNRYIPVQYTDGGVNLFPIGDDLDGSIQSTGSQYGSYLPASKEEAQRWHDLPPAPIPPGYYLFIGDNRNGSLDGRYWGLVPRKDIVGKAEFIWMPASRWRKLS